MSGSRTRTHSDDAPESSVKNYYDIAGDGGSDILQQVAAQQEGVVRSLAGVRNLLAVGSGKGGVGKSTLTMQLACALRELGNAVSILDADLNGPSQARLGGLQDRLLIPGKSGAPVPTARNGIGVVSMGSWVPEPCSVEFESVASGSSHTWRATRELTFLRELLACTDWGELDFVLVDLPPGAERIVQYAELLGPGALFVLVTIPSELATGVVARSLDALEKTPNRILGYVQNMDGYYCSDCRQIKPLFPAQSEVKLDLPCLGSVPFDPELAALCDLGGSSSEVPALVSWPSMLRIAEKVCQHVAERAAAPEERA
jgi:ATP-binding protein involved in chromosome partitioning